MKNIKILSFLTFLLLPLNSYSFDTGMIEKEIGGSRLLKSPATIEGVVFDRTITQTGFSFYKEFMQLWQVETLLKKYSVTLRETPKAREGSVIFIERGNVLLYKLVIGFRDKKIKENARNSLKVVKLKLKIKKSSL